jgi:hypothetical protein
MLKMVVVALMIFSSHLVFAADAPEVDVPVPVENPQVEKIPASTLTPEDRDVLARGEITDRESDYGKVFGTIVGFGTGQMFEKRYMSTGLILTVTEASATALIAFGFSTCNEGGFNNAQGSSAPTSKRCSVGAGIVGIVGMVGLKTWEIIDVWTAQSTQNAQYHFLKTHMVEDKKASNAPSVGLIPAVDLANNNIDGAAAALQFRF